MATQEADRAAQATKSGPGVADVKMIIGGEQVDAADGQTFDVVNPATGAVMARAPLGGPQDVNRAVLAASKAFDDPKGWPSWSAAMLCRRCAGSK